MSSALLQPESQVLSTLNADGSRRWLTPRLSPGRFLAARRVVGYGLIALFVTLPHLRLAGKPPILLDLARREFTFFGTTFLPTDTLLLALLTVFVFLSVFFVTALLGRVWCGWACPQTVYLEMVFRPLERLLGGARSLGGERLRAPLKVVRYAAYAVLAFALANTFLAYFVGTDALWHWMTQPPTQHPGGFLLVAGVSALMLFDFAFFREQTCLIACPYGRFQSVLLDRFSMIITYDRRRGEPRGRKPRTPASSSGNPLAANLALTLAPTQDKACCGDCRGEGHCGKAKAAPPPPPAIGDCVDCLKCVATCPTGIDIRDGLQLECIGCAQCIDACDDVMTRLGRPTGLIRYSSRAIMEGQAERLIRPRVLIYAALLLLVASAFLTVLLTRATADVALIRYRGLPYSVLDDQTVVNPVKLNIVNRSGAPQVYRLEVIEPAAGVELRDIAQPVPAAPGENAHALGVLAIEGDTFARAATLGHLDVRLRVRDTGTYDRVITFRALGPMGALPAATP